MLAPNCFRLVIPVRYQDCDAYGIVNAVNYLHFMLEATMAHNIAHGFTFDTWMKQGIAWLVRDTEIEFMRPLHYGETVTVTVRVADVRHTSAVRYYQLHERDTGELAATARSEFATASLDTRRPVPIPEDMLQAYFPEGVGKPAPRRRFPKAPPRPSEVLTWRTRVEWRDLDAQQHVSNATYLSYMQLAVLAQNEQIGWPIRRMLAQNQVGITQWIHILYRGQAMIGDEIEVTSYFSDLGTTSCVRHDVVSRLSDGAALAQGHTRWVWIDLETLTPLAIPAGYLSALEGTFVTTGDE
jgi:acyl-CoA thioester hydrolase